MARLGLSVIAAALVVWLVVVLRGRVTARRPARPAQG
jgi:hypothetical protein